MSSVSASSKSRFGSKSKNAAGSTYWNEARLPLVSLAFLAPLLAIYEWGVISLRQAGTPVWRNGADSWMRSWLLGAGFDFPFLLPALILVGLLAWQICGRYKWKFSWDTIPGMMAESILFAMCLIVLGQLQHSAVTQWQTTMLQVAPQTIHPEWSQRAISFVGAGIYEEVLFRLCLLPLMYGFFRCLALPHKGAACVSVVLSSAAFALAHYIEPAEGIGIVQSILDGADTVARSQDLWFGFAFRALAGIYFGTLLFLRGFGVTVGCHAAYDIFVGVVLVQNIS